jgi:hypothetical protein
MPESNYVQRTTGVFRAALDEVLDPSLEQLYVLLVLVKGELTTNQDVHDAWSIWRTMTNPAHKALVPFEGLELSVQELDRKYVIAIHAAARRIKES